MRLSARPICPTSCQYTCNEVALKSDLKQYQRHWSEASLAEIVVAVKQQDLTVLPSEIVANSVAFKLLVCRCTPFTGTEGSSDITRLHDCKTACRMLYSFKIWDNMRPFYSSCWRIAPLSCDAIDLSVQIPVGKEACLKQLASCWIGISSTGMVVVHQWSRPVIWCRRGLTHSCLNASMKRRLWWFGGGRRWPGLHCSCCQRNACRESPGFLE